MWTASVVCGWCAHTVGTVVRDELITGVNGAADNQFICDVPAVGLHKLTLLASIATLGCALGGHDELDARESTRRPLVRC